MRSEIVSIVLLQVFISTWSFSLVLLPVSHHNSLLQPSSFTTGTINSRRCYGGVVKRVPSWLHSSSDSDENTSLDVEADEVSDDTNIEESGSESDNDDSNAEARSNGDSSSTPGMSKAKWKKKRYLMIQDIITLTKKRDKHAPRKGEEAVTRMKKLSYYHNDEELWPDVQVYNHWINAISKCSQHSAAGKEAEEVLTQMRRDGVEPNIVSYTSVMDAYASSSTRHNKAAQDAERVLFDLLEEQQTRNCNNRQRLKVTSITCDVVLKAWANQGDMKGAERAEEILTRLEQMQNDDIRPTIISYGTVVHAWASCNGGVPAAETAEAILTRMLFPSSPVKPDTVIFNSVINAWANSRSPQMAQKASELLKQMQKLHNPRKGYQTAPDQRTYNAVLAAWSRSDESNAAVETERILKEMQDAYKKAPKEAPAPNTVSFNSVLHAWSRSNLPGALNRAQAVLEFMIKSNKPDIAPDVISFTSVLNALAKSKEPDKAPRARKLLDTMIKMHQISKRPTLEPSQIPFNAVLNACAFSALDTTDEEKQVALKVAVSTFSELCIRACPDTVSYGNLMKTYRTLMKPGKKRNEVALQLFDRCCKEGLVGELVWTETCRTVKAKDLQMHLGLVKGPGQILLKDLPKPWTNNVRGDKLAARRRTQTEAKRRDQQKREQTTVKKKQVPAIRFRNILEPSYQSGKDL